MNKKIIENLRLPIETVAFIKRVSKMSGASFDTVVNVLLAVDLCRAVPKKEKK